jgi:hypothetical protein
LKRIYVLWKRNLNLRPSCQTGNYHKPFNRCVFNSIEADCLFVL